jgi:hypothetical protein
VQIMQVKAPPLPAPLALALSQLQGGPTPATLPASGFALLVDPWDGYTANRQRVLEKSRDSAGDPVFLTGDIHSTWAADLPLDRAPTPACRRRCRRAPASSSSARRSPPTTWTRSPAAAPHVEHRGRGGHQGANRHIKELEFDSHGFSVVDITPERIQFDTFFISDREDPEATAGFYRGYSSVKGSRTVSRAATQVPPEPRRPAAARRRRPARRTRATSRRRRRSRPPGGACRRPAARPPCPPSPRPDWSLRPWCGCVSAGRSRRSSAPSVTSLTPPAGRWPGCSPSVSQGPPPPAEDRDMTVSRRTVLKAGAAPGALLLARPALAKPLGPTQEFSTSRRSRLFPGTRLVHADLHNHTLYSDGDGDPARAFASMRAAGGRRRSTDRPSHREQGAR